MATSTIRALILAAAVVVGGLLIAKAFPGNASQGIAPKVTPSPSPTVSPSSSPTSSPTPAGQTLIKGVRIQVLNGTTQTGLAAVQATRLRSAGYKIVTVEQSPVPYTRTTIYYKAGFKANAEAMKQRFYPEARVKPSPTSIQAKVALSVFLGKDAAVSPSPSSSTSTSHTSSPTASASA